MSAPITAIAADGTYFPIDKLTAHVQGTQHLAISVFLASNRGMLLQQRASEKYHSGGLWANACCSHPAWQEDPDICAQRRLVEELGLAVSLQRVGVVDYAASVGNEMTENERVYLYFAAIDPEERIPSPNPEEVQAIKWMRQAQVMDDLRDAPQNYSAWFQQYMSRDDPALEKMRALIDLAENGEAR